MHWLVLTLYGGLYDLDFGTTALYNLTDLPLTILFTYLFVYRILPLFFQRRYGAFVALALLTVVSALLLKRALTQFVTFPWLYIRSDYTFKFLNGYRMMGHFVELGTTAAIVAGLKHFRELQRSNVKVEALSAEKREAELSFLRAQVHPHFLFNTLNSIYYEVLRKSEAAPDLIIQLSDMLRFTLYECKDAQIPVAKEIALIHNYIALERCRYGERLQVDFAVTGDTACLVPPLICFSLVENAFKHGTSENKGPSHIEIQLVLTPELLRLQVQNPIAVADQADVLGASKGIGLLNITQQLKLLFADRYSLQSTTKENRFTCTLEMPLIPKMP